MCILTVPIELSGPDYCLTPLTSSRELDKVVRSQRHTTKDITIPCCSILRTTIQKCELAQLIYPHVTVVDDLAVLSRRHRDMQVMV